MLCVFYSAEVVGKAGGDEGPAISVTTTGRKSRRAAVRVPILMTG